MLPTRIVAVWSLVMTLPTAVAMAQINFPKSGYYVGLGDSVAAGEGALPVTGGYVYDLYDHGIFGNKQEMDFANAAVRGARSWELRDHQVAQVLCSENVQRPTVVTITAGANDFLRGDRDIFSIAFRVVDAINVLLNNGSGFVAEPVFDPVTLAPCRPLSGVTILVSNYYSIPHPDPIIAAQLAAALDGFDKALQYWLQHLHVPAGSRVARVDLYTPSLERQGLVTIERRGGIIGPFDFDVHPTNLGHSFIAQEFENAWLSLN
ncbi:MAG TPA: SGNH/GDSL hydrolase family protein [Vicinamibacterales bacterium]|nr:SGNH/GDSL hydrolase family protein [Vicinamibacterales bacterium]